jgi:hypothetical protein
MGPRIARNRNFLTGRAKKETTVEGRTMKNAGLSAGRTRLRRMRTSKKVITAVAFSALALGGVAATATPAFAGTNGQMIQLCPAAKFVPGWAVIQGHNQNGKSVDNDIRFQAKFGKDQCDLMENWWWVGTVQIAWNMGRAPHQLKVTKCIVPRDLPFTVTWTCRSGS